jgi:purine-binding chemotaxis protein CheW
MPVIEDRTQSILQERAKELARRGRVESRESTGESVAVFHVGDESMAVPVQYLKSVIPVPAITPVPGQPPWMVGVLQVQGVVVSAVDLALWLGAPRARQSKLQTEPATQHGYLALLELKQRLLGLVIDGVAGVREIFLDEIVEKQAIENTPGTLPVRWLTRDLVAVLDVQGVFELASRRTSLASAGAVHLTKENRHE